MILVGANLLPRQKHICQLSLECTQRLFSTGCGRLKPPSNKEPMHCVEQDDGTTKPGGSYRALIHKNSNHDDYNDNGCGYLNATVVEISSLSRRMNCMI